ncbi:MAG: hypothetical protein Greene07144_1057 [Parcubacteria group bacterium Greene0714_4]|nr:MAG: hypothetical protein Greene07144_1057 [Parcubacteria group bacterium Greene0714_4]
MSAPTLLVIHGVRESLTPSLHASKTSAAFQAAVLFHHFAGNIYHKEFATQDIQKDNHVQ